MTAPLTAWDNARHPDGTVGRAEFSADRTRRLVLIRRWVHSFTEGAETVTWVMLNPSTAGAGEDDATIRKCTGYAKRWGFGGLRVLNLFDLIATDPRALAAHPEPCSRANLDAWATWLAPHGGGAWTANPPAVIAAWGDGARMSFGGHPGVLNDRDVWAATFFEVAGIQPRCLGTTKGGQPLHPGRTSYDLKPIPWAA